RNEECATGRLDSTSFPTNVPPALTTGATPAAARIALGQEDVGPETVAEQVRKSIRTCKWNCTASSIARLFRRRWCSPLCRPRLRELNRSRNQLPRRRARLATRRGSRHRERLHDVNAR